MAVGSVLTSWSLSLNLELESPVDVYASVLLIHEVRACNFCIEGTFWISGHHVSPIG